VDSSTCEQPAPDAARSAAPVGGKLHKRDTGDAHLRLGVSGARTARRDSLGQRTTVRLRGRAGGLTSLSVWWIQLGIQVERITPGKPQENGRQERFHRTLKAETARPPRADLRCQQRAFDELRGEYNNERPHEALGQKTPSTAFAHSRRRYPRSLKRFEVAPWNRAARIDKHGRMSWDGKHIFISTALAHEDAQLRYDDSAWDVVFGALSVGILTEGGGSPKFTPSKGRMKDRREVSGMSSD
jgi:hypothetical protein